MTRRCTLPEPWRSLATLLGGVQALADTLQTGPRAIHAWAHWTRLPHWRTRRAAEDLFALHGLGRPTWKDKR